MTALIWCPFADRDSARSVCETLLREGLIGCANLMPCDSLFRWQGVIEHAEEVGVLMKTHSSQLELAIARLEALHPYDEAAIVGWRADAAGRACESWLAGIAAQMDGHGER